MHFQHLQFMYRAPASHL